MEKIGIIGAGYVGLTSAVCFAKFGFEVFVFDKDLKKLDLIEKGEAPFFEPELTKLLEKGIFEKKIKVVKSLKDLFLFKPKFIFCCVNTPLGEKKEVDLSFVFDVVRNCIKNAFYDFTFFLKSTVPPGTCKKVQSEFEKSSKFKVMVVSNPEFLSQASAINDFLNPNKIVFGLEKRDIFFEKTIFELHKNFAEKEKFIFTDFQTSELIKYSSNSILATKVSFINQIERISQKVGADIFQISKALEMDPRVGSNYLEHGIGYGGGCLEKDICALISFSKKLKINVSFLETVENFNQDQKKYFLKKAIKNFSKELKNKKIGVVGLSFKQKTSDTRNSGYIFLVKEFLNLGLKVFAFDPLLKKSSLNFKNENFFFLESEEAVLKNSDLVIKKNEIFKPKNN